MSKKEEQVIVLPREHMSVLGYLRYRDYLPSPPSVCRRKNVKDSTKYRQRGNDLYKMRYHDEIIHEQIWKTYSQSIALAPNNSEELACGYGNRSALLFHLKKFKDCIKDCNRAIAITQSNILKTKLLTRKAECLCLLNKSATEEVCNEALQLLNNLKLDDKTKQNYTDKLNDILTASNVMTISKEKSHNKDRKKYCKDLSNFSRSEEVPCASKSVAIHYSKKWGRHIVATEDMKPGEIFALEKTYYTYINQNGMYLYCSNCAKYAWSSIPCEHCIYDVYCSESCRSEAWDKYHQWECPIYPFIWDIEQDIHVMPFNFRLIFIGITEIGGIDNMKKLLIDLDKCKDPRTKGFSNGVFQTDSIRSIYSLTKHYIANDLTFEHLLAEKACIIIELLARHTTFFGQKMNGSVSKIFKNQDVVFLTALILHTQYITRNNAEDHFPRGRILDDEQKRYATTMTAFTSLINHNCDPNIRLAFDKNNITFAFTVKPIKKGTQLMNCYTGQNFLDNSKDERQSYLKYSYNFNCQCLACTENWSNNCLPSVKEILEVSPQLIETYSKILSNMSQRKKIISEKSFVYSPKLMRDITFYLDSMAEKITTYSAEYEEILNVLEKILTDVFGYFHFTIPDSCFSS